MLQIYNSQTKQKQNFQPIEPNKVSMYVCGQTVYDYCHLGHARKEVAFDVVYRYLQYRGYQVNYVRNITDIDDKIIKRANENKESFTELTTRMIQAMHEDFAQLGVSVPSQEPKATQHIDGMVEMIQSLIDKGFAYPASNGDVYYQVSKFAEYGKLSHRNLEDLRAGERVDVAAEKRDPLDFVLWKAAKPEEPSWDSPWGKGRPGWHIECSVMANCCLHQANIDIHGGGMDLMFPHHENEIAQSEAANGKTFTNIWMHAGFLQINDEKMSKSLGNFFTIRETLAKFQPESLRYFFLTTHYRSPFNYSEQGVHEAHAALERLYTALRELPTVQAPVDSEYEKRFIEKMDDDFNMPEALAVLFELAREINRLREADQNAAAKLAALLKKLGAVLGILQQDPEVVLKTGLSASASGLSDEEIEQLIAQRNQARADKNWAESDRIRDQLKQQGVLLEDQAGKTIWRR